MSQLEVDKIIPQSGTTLTIGDSGDTISFADGATIAIDTNTLYVDSSNNRVGIGTSSPQGVLTLTKGTLSGQTAATDTNDLVLDGTTGVGISFLTNNTGNARIRFGDTDNTSSGLILYQHTNDYLRLDTAGSERMRIDSSGNVGIGTSSPATTLDIQGGNITQGATGSNAGRLLIDNTTDTIQRIKVSRGGSTGQLAFHTGTDSEAMRITSSGNVGIGISSPSTPLDVAGKGTFSGAGSFEALELITSDTNRVYVTGNSSVSGDMWRVGTSTSNPNLNIDVVQASGEILLRTGGTNERMRIDSSGNVCIGVSSPYTDNSTDSFLNVAVVGANYGAWISKAGTASSRLHLRFANPNGIVGSISTSGTATAFTTSSDHRLKENVNYDFDATSRLKQLKPVRFNFITDADTTVDGFLAHEVSDIVPEAITGTKDEVDADGNPVYQGIDQSKLVPLLTASLKEAINKIEQLEARISALET